MEGRSISPQSVRVYLWLKGLKEWATNNEISQGTGIPDRTVRFKTKQLADLGICELVPTFTGYRYRFNPSPSQKNLEMRQRLEEAAKIFKLAQ